ncbi:hypothetical protein JQ633_01380 [Bradyrhizobium tropiciagri]|nr:hypothetical protein [Bradyrhizobium tropiciagri]
MHRDAIMDELRRIELDVVEGEKQLAEYEGLLVELRRTSEDTRRFETTLEVLQEHQSYRERRRQQLLSMLQP